MADLVDLFFDMFHKEEFRWNQALKKVVKVMKVVKVADVVVLFFDMFYK